MVKNNSTQSIAWAKRDNHAIRMLALCAAFIIFMGGIFAGMAFSAVTCAIGGAN